MEVVLRCTNTRYVTEVESEFEVMSFILVIKSITSLIYDWQLIINT